MRPIIGITSSYAPESDSQALPSAYVRAIESAGGLPFIIPAGIARELVDDVLNSIDGLLLSGGVDIDPQIFGEDPHQRLGTISPERDFIEIPLTEAALKRGLPLLAICRGIQVLNVAAGGTLIQDIPSQVPGAIKHRQEAPRWLGTHAVTIEAGSKVASLLGTTRLSVNTYHHQSVKEVAPGFRLSAEAPDGIIEAIESARADRFAVGVQWHPETMFERVPVFAGLFRGLAEAAATGRRDDQIDGARGVWPRAPGLPESSGG
ncbi:MAG TPA: gamma-glutamyl-gamma-aminobutyrate hydrolase family protein [Bacillota bacterium]|nr:gamma-glutamyl-gamma-aminobutyrate hydrolase family protein [Bacillota bacterium]